MKSKKSALFLFGCIILGHVILSDGSASSHASNIENQSSTNKFRDNNAIEIEKEFYQTEHTQIDDLKILHNNGLPMNTDIIDETSNPMEEKIFGVLTKGNIEVYYSSNSDKVNTSTIISALQKSFKDTAISDDYKRLLIFHMNLETGFRKVTTVQRLLLTKDPDINFESENETSPKLRSRWTITSDSFIWGYVKRYSHTHDRNNPFTLSPVSNHILKLSAETDTQHLMSWDSKEFLSSEMPSAFYNSTNKKKVDLIDSFKVIDESSSYHNYALWDFSSSPLTSKKILNTTAKIQVLIVRGDLFIQSSSSFKLGLGAIESARKNIYQTDRSD